MPQESAVECEKYMLLIVMALYTAIFNHQIINDSDKPKFLDSIEGSFFNL
jgi:hypothetical protein